MSKLYDELKINYPFLFSGVNQFYGCSCGDGWRKLVFEVFDKLEQLNCEGLYVVQIKEKFGRLTIYTSIHTKEIGEILSEASRKSLTVCEECGTTEDVTVGGSWIKALCNRCRENRLKQRSLK